MASAILWTLALIVLAPVVGLIGWLGLTFYNHKRWPEQAEPLDPEEEAIEG